MEATKEEEEPLHKSWQAGSKKVASDGDLPQKLKKGQEKFEEVHEEVFVLDLTLQDLTRMAQARLQPRAKKREGKQISKVHH